MIKKVIKTIEKYKLLEKGDRVVVALSGGPDSTALLAALAQISKELDFDIIVAHFNHGLRGTSSDEDENYSQAIAEKLGLIFVTGKMDSKLRQKGVSPEDFYRQERYQFLNKVAKDNNAQKIALGHNLQDQAETVLLNLLRGSGLEGLRGILPMREGKFIRPLIEITRDEIIGFLSEAGLSYCHDSSNESSIYLRNKIRSELIPYLKEKFNPKIVENLAQMAETLRLDDELIRNSVEQVLQSKHIQNQPDGISLNIEYLKGLAPAIRSRLFKEILESLSPEKNGFSFSNIKALDRLVQLAESGKRISLPLAIEARREYDKLILTRDNPGLKQVDYEYPINIPCVIHVKEINRTISVEKITRGKMDLQSKIHGYEPQSKLWKHFVKSCGVLYPPLRGIVQLAYSAALRFLNRSFTNKVYLDFDKIQQPVTLRNRRNGDRFQPLGMKGRQKIKSLIINQKIPRNRRNEAMLLVDQDSVIWIENMHLSERVKISPQAKNIISLEIMKS
ncbi:MAG: tRNA lysidine(34) synthetase TilS [Deltaproteobacteria bacterium]